MENAKEKRAAVRIWADGERYAVSGVLTEAEGRCALLYDEPGLDGSPTRFVFDGASARMERGGAYPAVLELAAGQTFHGEYGSPFGTARLSVRTERLSVAAIGNGWRVELFYALCWNGGAWEPHELSLAVTV